MSKREIPVQSGEIHTAEIIGLNHEGEGVGRVSGFTVFIPGALPGEKVRAEVTEVRKSFGRGSLVEVLEASPNRVEPACPVYEQCGGCQLQHMDYASQLEAKRQLVADALERIGKLQDVLVRPTIGMEQPWHYRNKTHMPVGTIEGGLVSGFYAKGTRNLIPVDRCLISSDQHNEIVKTVKRIAAELGISAYRPDTGRGLIRHVITRIAANTGEVMVILVSAARQLPKQDEFVQLLRMEIPRLTSLILNVNQDRSSLVMGHESIVLWGSETIRDTIGDLEFAISPRSFYQINPVQTERLYNKALEYAALTGTETVIDAYCGIGTIALFMARYADQVYGVEIVREAIEDAKRNAALNDIRNAKFEAGKAEDVLPAWRSQGITADVIVVDPPRKGCDPALLETIIAMQPSRVVYVSCNPATLARDLRILADGGFRVVEAQPVDMFPQSSHVECLILMVSEE